MLGSRPRCFAKEEKGHLLEGMIPDFEEHQIGCQSLWRYPGRAPGHDPDCLTSDLQALSLPPCFLQDLRLSVRDEYMDTWQDLQVNGTVQLATYCLIPSRVGDSMSMVVQVPFQEGLPQRTFASSLLPT